METELTRVASDLRSAELANDQAAASGETDGAKAEEFKAKYEAVSPLFHNALSRWVTWLAGAAQHPVIGGAVPLCSR